MHQHVASQQSNQITTNCVYRHAGKNRGLFNSANVDVSSRNNFANFGSSAKVSLPVQSSIPWVHTMVVGVCNTMISNACTQPQLPLSNESLGLLEYKNY